MVMSIQREVEGSYVMRSSLDKLAELQESLGVVERVIIQYPSGLIVVFDVV